MRKKILIAEDNRSFRMILNFVLTQTYDVQSVENGEALEQALQTGTFELLIADLNLPKKTAGSVLRSYLRQLPPEKTPVPTIIVTGFDDQNEEVQSVGRLVNVREVLTKPVDFRKLKQRVDEYLQTDGGLPVTSQIYRAVASLPRVLVVDDEEEIRELMYTQLDEASIETRTCSSVEEALRLCSENVFDAVVFDFVLADGTADDALAKLPEATRNTKLPLAIIVTGFGDTIQADHFKEHPFVKAVLTKPFGPNDLAKCVKEVLAGGTDARPDSSGPNQA